MLTAALALGVIGLLAAVLLGVAAKVFYVYVDPLVVSLEEALPGANCGGCGYAGCAAAAVAISKGLMPANGCVAGGADIHAEIAAILGVEIVATEPEIARVGCRYPVERADIKYAYSGINDCRAAVILSGGPKECPVGCIGLGSCVKACPFDALSMGPDGLPVVDEEKCTGCGTCVRTCPMGIMTLTSVSNRILGEYTSDECTAPCQRACPAGIDVPEQIRQTSLGHYRQALLVIKERNPLPLICGRICPHPCEFECRRNLADEPVAINYLKRFVADYERTKGRHVKVYRAPETGRRLAVIGGGAEGLTAAYFLARLGHSPVILEAMPKLGGLLRTIIPESRLPRDVLDWEIEGILGVGVEARTGQAFGQDFHLSTLFDEGFEAILLATGGWDSMLIRESLSAQAPALPRVYLLLPLTLAWASGQEVELGNRVVIIGGDNAALEAGRTCRQQGVEEVIVLVRRSQAEAGLSDADLARAGDEGIGIKFSTCVTRLMGQGDRMTELAFVEGSGGNERVIEVDAVIAASGRLPEMIIVPQSDQAEGGPGDSLRWQTITPYRVPSQWPQGLFDATEPVRDYWTTVEAVGAGRRAAASVHKIITGQEIAPPSNMLEHDTKVLDVDHLDNLLRVEKRQEMPEATMVQRLDLTQEVELGLSREAARAEARRCLNCGLICYYRTKYH